MPRQHRLHKADSTEAVSGALELRPEYDDAMAYLNLLLRRKADEAATHPERADLLKQADALVDKAKEITRKKMESPAKS